MKSPTEAVKAHKDEEKEKAEVGLDTYEHEGKIFQSGSTQKLKRKVMVGCFFYSFFVSEVIKVKNY